MPPPATLADLVAVIRSSRLVDDARLRAAAGHAGAEAGLLDRLVADGALTPFQAGRLGRGKWRGFHVGPYRILDRLGRGGMGRVYLARHAPTGRDVALKVLASHLADDPTAVARFGREAHAAAAIAHPNVVRVLDVDAAARPPFLVFEYVAGVTLQAAVARTGTFPGGLAADLARQVALGLQAAHDRGLVHRDVKPATVLADRRGRAKLLDLGIVKLRGEASDLTLSGADRLILGTADYLAPEQALDSSAVDIRADLYALGGVAYFLLAGHPPFPAGSAFDKLQAKQEADPAPLDRLRPDVPAGLCRVVHTLLARDPARRYAAPHRAAHALAAFARPDPAYMQTVAGRAPAPTEADTPALGPDTESVGSAVHSTMPSTASGLDLPPLPAAADEAGTDTAIITPGPRWRSRGRRAAGLAAAAAALAAAAGVAYWVVAG